MTLETLFLLFIIYSFLGWLMEELLVSIKEKKLVDRGFLIGPICPIYGSGALLITIFLENYHNDILVLFVLATILGAILEYFTSYIMEKIFKVRWWDYSHDKYNLNGRICLKTSICFGILGVIMIHFLNPFFLDLLELIPNTVLQVISIVLAILLVIDTAVSFSVISKIKKIDLSGARDATDEITAKVREVLKSKSFFTKRLVDAFPNLKSKIKEEVKKLGINLEEELQKIEKIRKNKK